MYTIQYFDDTVSPQFPDIQSLVDYHIQHPDLDACIFYQNDYNHRIELVAAWRSDIILNGKPRRKFVNHMAEYIKHIPDQIHWQTKK